MREEIINTINVLKNGGTILYPTDTIWGLGCDAINNKAVQKIYKIKKRREAKSFIILLDQEEKLIDYVEEVPEIAWDLMHNINRPLSIVYPNAKNLPKSVIADDGSIAIRIVKNEFCKRLINLFNKPIISTSANISGEEVPTYFSKISSAVKDNVDYIVKLHQGIISDIKPSTMIKFNNSNEFTIIRN